jgi:hypothetical protein
VSSKTEGARRRVRITRDGVLFVVGLAGIIYETVVNRGDNLPLIFFFGGLCGLPFFLRSDELMARKSERHLEESARPLPEPKESP